MDQSRDRRPRSAENPVRLRPVIDEIDRVLAKRYGFTDEELDFIINTDIKCRMGGDVGEPEED